MLRRNLQAETAELLFCAAKPADARDREQREFGVCFSAARKLLRHSLCVDGRLFPVAATGSARAAARAVVIGTSTRTALFLPAMRVEETGGHIRYCHPGGGSSPRVCSRSDVNTSHVSSAVESFILTPSHVALYWAAGMSSGFALMISHRLCVHGCFKIMK